VEAKRLQQLFDTEGHRRAARRIALEHALQHLIEFGRRLRAQVAEASRGLGLKPFQTVAQGA
jgi:hypothetical protein